MIKTDLECVELFCYTERYSGIAFITIIEVYLN